jgi:hypothetical protein
VQAVKLGLQFLVEDPLAVVQVAVGVDRVAQIVVLGRAQVVELQTERVRVAAHRVVPGVDELAAGLGNVAEAQLAPERPAAPAHPVPRLQHCHVPALAVELVGRGETGEPRADHDHAPATAAAAVAAAADQRHAGAEGKRRPGRPGHDLTPG